MSRTIRHGLLWALAVAAACATDACGQSIVNAGATNVLRTGAWIRYTVVSTNATNPVVTVYYGTSNGGTNSAAWATNVVAGTYGTGTWSVAVSNLSPATWYYARAAAQEGTNAVAWAPSTTNFTTLAGAPTNTPTPATDWPQPVMVDSNGVVIAPESFFTANAESFPDVATPDPQTPLTNNAGLRVRTNALVVGSTEYGTSGVGIGGEPEAGFALAVGGLVKLAGTHRIETDKYKVDNAGVPGGSGRQVIMSFSTNGNYVFRIVVLGPSSPATNKFVFLNQVVFADEHTNIFVQIGATGVKFGTNSFEIDPVTGDWVATNVQGHVADALIPNNPLPFGQAQRLFQTRPTNTYSFLVTDGGSNVVAIPFGVAGSTLVGQGPSSLPTVGAPTVQATNYTLAGAQDVALTNPANGHVLYRVNGVWSSLPVTQLTAAAAGNADRLDGFDSGYFMPWPGVAPFNEMVLYFGTNGQMAFGFVPTPSSNSVVVWNGTTVTAPRIEFEGAVVTNLFQDSGRAVLQMGVPTPEIPLQLTNIALEGDTVIRDLDPGNPWGAKLGPILYTSNELDEVMMEVPLYMYAPDLDPRSEPMIRFRLGRPFAPGYDSVGVGLYDFENSAWHWIEPKEDALQLRGEDALYASPRRFVFNFADESFSGARSITLSREDGTTATNATLFLDETGTNMLLVWDGHTNQFSATPR